VVACGRQQNTASTSPKLTSSIFTNFGTLVAVSRCGKTSEKVYGEEKGERERKSGVGTASTDTPALILSSDDADLISCRGIKINSKLRHSLNTFGDDEGLHRSRFTRVRYDATTHVTTLKSKLAASTRAALELH
jgi:hypothetical protein